MIQRLNIHGRCENSTCAAFRRWVTHRKYFESFNLLRDGSIQCPMCRSKVKPITCSFYDCAWKFEGVRAQDGFSIISPWKDASGHKYHRFDADETHGLVEWESLLIIVKPRCDTNAAKLVSSPHHDKSKKDVCTACWTKFESISKRSIATAPCGHSFHRGCLDKWSTWSNNHYSLPSCPICLRAVQTPLADL